MKSAHIALAIAEKYEMEAAVITSLQPGAVETLKELKKMNLKIGLCTTSSETAANYILQRFKICRLLPSCCSTRQSKTC